MRFRTTLAIALLLAFLGTVPASLQAQDPLPSREKDRENKAKVLGDLVNLKSRLETCGNLSQDRAQRLRCYDNIAEDLGYIDPDLNSETESKLAQFGFWNVVEKKSEIGEISVFLKLDSTNSIRSASGHGRFPTLILRCKNKKTDAYIDWGGLLGDPKGREKSVYVSYKFDAGEEKAEEWEYSLDYQSAFAPTPVDFVRKLKGKTKLAIEVTPYNQGMATLLFNTEGFENALAVLVDRCYK